jgi:hypothetical protein
VIAYRATLDVSRELVQFVAKLLAAERRRRGTPKGSRALTCFWQAVLGLRWFRTAPRPTHWPATTASPGPPPTATGTIEVLASQAPDLRHALDRARQEGFAHVILDGTVIACDRCKEPAHSVKGEVTSADTVPRPRYVAQGRVPAGQVQRPARRRSPGVPAWPVAASA